ncbi:MAG: hypothetical protein R6X34_11700 [Chloroflexota bacterium]
MSYQEKNVTVSLVSFSLILGFYLTRVFQMLQDGGLTNEVFGLWAAVIVLGIIVTIVLTILAHIGFVIIEAIKTGSDDPKIDETEDERDKLIDLKGTKMAYLVSSIGAFLAMLTFALGQSPFVMFTLLILSGLVAQVLGDVARLILYRRGF